jgi:hypothetical protein
LALSVTYDEEMGGQHCETLTGMSRWRRNDSAWNDGRLRQRQALVHEDFQYPDMICTTVTKSTIHSFCTISDTIKIKYLPSSIATQMMKLFRREWLSSPAILTISRFGRKYNVIPMYDKSFHSQYSRTPASAEVCQRNGEPAIILSPCKMRWSTVAVSLLYSTFQRCSGINSVTFRSLHAHSHSHSPSSHPGTS